MLLTSKQKLRFNIRSIYWNATIVLRPTTPRAQPERVLCSYLCWKTTKLFKPPFRIIDTRRRGTSSRRRPRMASSALPSTAPPSGRVFGIRPGCEFHNVVCAYQKVEFTSRTIISTFWKSNTYYLISQQKWNLHLKCLRLWMLQHQVESFIVPLQCWGSVLGQYVAGHESVNHDLSRKTDLRSCETLSKPPKRCRFYSIHDSQNHESCHLSCHLYKRRQI